MTTRRAKRITGVGLLLLGLTGAATLVWAHAGHDEGIEAKGIKLDEEGNLLIEAAARKAIGLATAEVQLANLEQRLRLNSRIVIPWDRKGFASTRIEGVVLEIHVRPGQTVKAGSSLATIESLPLEALRQKAEQARIELALAEVNLTRARELGETIIAGREILMLEARRDDRRNTVETLRQKLKAIGAGETPRVSIRAPMDGTVIKIDVVPGQHVEPNEHLFEIYDLSTVWAELEVPETHVGRVQLGQEVALSFVAVGDRVFEGTIDFISSTLDPHLHLRRAFVSLDNPEQVLLAGMFGTGSVVLERVEDAFVVPAEGIVTDGAERYAFVLVEEGTYTKTKVVLGARSENGVEVLSGLYPGDVVVTQGNHELGALFVQGTLKLSDEAKQTIGYSVEEVDYRTVDRVLQVNARVVVPVSRRGLAASRMEGKVVGIRMKLGQQIEAGQIMAEVHSLELQNTQLDMVLANLRRGVASKQLELLRSLEGVAPRKELARLESDVGLAESQIAALRRRLLVMGLEGADVKRVLETGKIRPTVFIRAPLAGQVADIHVVLGQVVQPGDPLFELVDTSQLWVEGAFFEADLPALRKGGFKKLTVVHTTAFGKHPQEAKLSFLNPILDGDGRSLAAYVELDNEDARLLPGMQATLTVSIERPPETVIAVPLRALLTIDRKQYIFVEKKDGFDRVVVTLGRRDAHYAEVTQGVFPGDQVVVSGVNELNNALSAVR